MEMRRVTSMLLGAVVLSGVAGCSSGPAFPDTIFFDEESLKKDGNWTRGGVSAAVYTRPGQKLPDADLQVGVILSTDHTTADALHRWIIEGYHSSGTTPFYDSGTIGESCKVGATTIAENRGPRVFMSLHVCQTGVGRAACVEADEVLDGDVFTACLRSDKCFEDVCDERWLLHREALDLLVADMLTKR